VTGEVPRRLRLTTQVVVGLGVIGFGLILTARNLGWIDRVQLHEILRYWPLLIVAVGLLKFVQATCTSARVFAGLMVVVGAWLTADHFYNLQFHFWDWWPLVLVAFGLHIILRAGLGPPAAVDRGDTGSNEFAFWSGIQRRIASPNFASASLTAIMGGIEIDLRAAGAANGQAVIDVFALWGGIEIRVSPDWAVHNQVTAIMGGAVDSSAGTQAARHHLTVRGFVLMGGIEIKN
jgi:predicted membrane protein